MQGLGIYLCLPLLFKKAQLQSEKRGSYKKKCSGSPGAERPAWFPVGGYGFHQKVFYLRCKKNSRFSSFENNIGQIDGWKHRPTDGRTRPLIEMRSRI